MVRVRNDKTEPELCGNTGEQINQRHRIRAPRHGDERLPRFPEEPILSNVRQQSRWQRRNSGHVS